MKHTYEVLIAREIDGEAREVGDIIEVDDEIAASLVDEYVISRVLETPT